MNYDTKMAIVVRRDLRNKYGLKVKTGKIAAQAGHAAMAWIGKRILPPNSDGYTLLDLSSAEFKWLNGPTYTKIVLGADSEEELIELVNKAKGIYIAAELITDLGLTEFSEPTVTCAAIGPATNDLVDRITGQLRPL